MGLVCRHLLNIYNNRIHAVGDFTIRRLLEMAYEIRIEVVGDEKILETSAVVNDYSLASEAHSRLTVAMNEFLQMAKKWKREKKEEHEDEVDCCPRT